MLSSDTEQMTHGSLGFHEKSEILDVCPPWIKSSSVKEWKIRNYVLVFKYIKYIAVKRQKPDVRNPEMPISNLRLDFRHFFAKLAHFIIIFPKSRFLGVQMVDFRRVSEIWMFQNRSVLACPASGISP